VWIWRLQGKRIVVFVVGGITRSEMRVAHMLSKRLERDIVLGGTSLLDPDTFLKNLLVGPFFLQH
jgi:syntaxin-binding protein 1